MNIKDIINKIKTKIREILTGNSTISLPDGRTNGTSDSLKNEKHNFRSQLAKYEKSPNPPTFEELLSMHNKKSQSLETLKPTNRSSQFEEIKKLFNDEMSKHFKDYKLNGINGYVISSTPRDIVDHITYAFSTYYQGIITDTTVVTDDEIDKICESIKSHIIPYTQKQPNGIIKTKNKTLQEILISEIKYTIMNTMFNGKKLEQLSTLEKRKLDEETDNFLNKPITSDNSGQSVLDKIIRLTIEGELTNLKECYLIGNLTVIDEALCSFPNCDSKFEEQHNNDMFELYTHIITDLNVPENKKQYIISHLRALWIGDKPGLINPQEFIDKIKEISASCPQVNGSPLVENSTVSPVALKGLISASCKQIAKLGGTTQLGSNAPSRIPDNGDSEPDNGNSEIEIL